MFRLIINVRVLFSDVTAVGADTDELPLMHYGNGVDKMKEYVGMERFSLYVKPDLLPF